MITSDLIARRTLARIRGQTPIVESAIWQPQPGPQTAAYYSGGKTDLGLGLAGTQHRRSIIFRRVFPSVRGIIERSREIFNAYGAEHSRDSYNESLHIWRLASGRQIEFGSLQYETDKKKYQGQPHDLYVFDEVTEFTESQVRFVIGWNRSTYVDPVTRQPQRCRVLMTFNPPFDEAGEWVTRYFAPWLDDKHPHPAADGELRWYATIEGEEREVEEADLGWYVLSGRGHRRVDSGQAVPDDEAESGYLIPVRAFEHDGDLVMARSRTFFHASLRDNPILEATGYGATIDAMPEPLRSLLKGKFNVVRLPDPWQVIPTDWIKAAQARWTAQPPDLAMRAMGVDVARGGKDQTCIARMVGEWLDLHAYPGVETPDGPSVAARVIGLRQGDPPIGVDVIGVGASAYDSLRMQDLPVQPINFAESSDGTDKTGALRMVNVRAEAYWTLREALDPANGQAIALPPDDELRADLAAPHYKIVPRGIQIEAKEDIAERIGRSPDKGDAVAIALYVALNYRPNGGIWG